MAKYKVLKEFLLRDDPKKAGKGKLLKAGKVVDITVKRAEAAEKNLAKHEGPFLERVKEGE